MTTFKGYGPGIKGGWKKRRYLPDGTVVEDGEPRAARTATCHVRFKPMVSHQVEGKVAKKLGLARTSSRGTVFQSERDLNRYLAYEKAHGRDVGWKDHE